MRLHLDLYLDLNDGGDDGEERGVGAARPQLPRLERHVDVAVLDQRERAELTRLERNRPVLCNTHRRGRQRIYK